MAVDFNLPTVATNYTAFPTQIIENIDAALQQLSVGSPSNVPTNAIKWDATANRWKKYNGSAFVDLTSNYDLNANLDVTQLTLGDSEKIRLGASQDLEIFHDQTLGHSFIKDTGTGNLKICGSTVDLVNAQNTALLLRGSAGSGGTTSLYQNGNQRLKTLSTGVEIFGTSLDLGDNVSLNLGTNDDLKLVHNDTDGIIENTKGIFYIKKSDGSGSSQDGIKMEANSKISLFHSTGVGSNPQFETTTDGIFLRGQNLGSSLNDEVIIFDNATAISNSSRLQIKHVRDATTNTSWTTSATRIQMRVDNTDQGYVQFNGADNLYGMELGTNGLEKFAYFVRNGKAELYFDNVAKLATASSGVDITGSLNTTGELNFTGSAAKFIDFETLAGSNRFELRHHNPSGNLFEIAIKATASGSVDLFYDAGTYSTPKLSTTATGITVTGGITASSTGNASLILDAGTGSQAGNQISFIDFKIDGTVKANIAVNEGVSGTPLEINSAGTGATKLFNAGSAKLATTSTGVSVTGSLTTDGFTSTTSGDAIFTGTTSGRNAKWDTSHNRLIFDDNAYAVFGSGVDLVLYHDATDSFIQNNTGQLILRVASVENAIIAKPNAAVELYYDNVKQVQTFSSGLNWQDNKKAEFGNSGDLKIYHDGTHSHILEEGGGNLALHTNTGGEIQLAKNDSGQYENMLRAIPDGAVILAYDNSTKLETTSTGVSVTGTCTATSFAGDGSALTGITTDLKSLNEASSTGESSTSSGAFQSKVTLTISTTSTTRVLVFFGFSHEHGDDDNNQRVTTQLVTTNGSFVGGNPSFNNTEDYERQEGQRFDISSHVGTRTYTLEFRSSNGSARIKDAYLVAIAFDV